MTAPQPKPPKGISFFARSGKFRGHISLAGKPYYTRLYATADEARVARDELFKAVSARLRGVPTATAWGVAPGRVLGSATFTDGSGPLPELPLHDFAVRRFRNETSRARAW